MRVRTAVSLIAALLSMSVGASAQTRSDQLLWAARQHIGTNQLDSAEAELRSALDLAPYQMDSSYVYGWWGVLAYLRGSDSLARVSFRQAANLNARISLPGLDLISPGAASLFDAEIRGGHAYGIGSLEQPPRRSAGPPIVYPPELRRLGVAGHALRTPLNNPLQHAPPQHAQIPALTDNVPAEP